MSQFSVRLIFAALVTALVAVSSCGPSLEQQQAAKACHDQCGIALANCYESKTCLDIDGQVIPCEEECQGQQSNCEDNCSGD